MSRNSEGCAKASLTTCRNKKFALIGRQSLVYCQMCACFNVLKHVNITLCSRSALLAIMASAGPTLYHPAAGKTFFVQQFFGRIAVIVVRMKHSLIVFLNLWAEPAQSPLDPSSTAKWRRSQLFWLCFELKLWRTIRWRYYFSPCRFARCPAAFVLCTCQPLRVKRACDVIHTPELPVNTSQKNAD